MTGKPHANHPSVFINDDEAGLEHDYDAWTERIAARRRRRVLVKIIGE